MNVTPVIVVPALVLVMMMRMTLAAPARMGLVTKVLVIVGSVSVVTFSNAAAAVGSGALSNVARNAGLVLSPNVEVTKVVTVQLPPGANVIFDKPILLLAVVPVPAVMAAVEPPVQLSVTNGPFVFVKPAG